MTPNSEEILSLVRSKNRCLERLMAVTQEVLTLSDEKLLEKEMKSNNSPLDIYDRERIAVTRSIELFDGKISEVISSLTIEEKQSGLIEVLKAEMHKSELLLESIFSADDIVFKKINDMQKLVSNQLMENRKSREMLSKFRSQWVPEAGDEVDTTL
jgi:hypothetical protein